MTSGKPLTDAERESILRLFASGDWAKAAIARRLGITRRVVQLVIDQAAISYWRAQSATSEVPESENLV